MRQRINLIAMAIVSVLLSSCASTYRYCQIFETKPVNQDNNAKIEDGKLVYENPQCTIEYNFWADGGNASFSFYNKTDEIIYIDLAKSFYVQNGVAYDIYRARQWSHGTSVEHASSSSYGYGITRSYGKSVGLIVPSIVPDGVAMGEVSKSKSNATAAAKSSTVAQTSTSTVSIKEKQIIAVPPHSKKDIETYNVVTGPLLSCDLQRFPSQSANLKYSLENTPYRFADIITYKVGENGQTYTVNNEFYVSTITNYAEPEIIIMKKRDEPCENLKDPDYISPTVDLYDKLVKENVCEEACSFYKTYDTKTTKKLYTDDSKDNYTYDTQYSAYVKSKSGGSPTVALAILGTIISAALIISVSTGF